VRDGADRGDRLAFGRDRGAGRGRAVGDPVHPEAGSPAASPCATTSGPGPRSAAAPGALPRPSQVTESQGPCRQPKPRPRPAGIPKHTALAGSRALQGIRRTTAGQADRFDALNLPEPDRPRRIVPNPAIPPRQRKTCAIDGRS
jgi:hypothetical protein